MNVLDSRFNILLPDGGQLSALHLPRPGSRRIVFSHGAGLAVGCYSEFILALARQYDVVAVDLRGHGRSVETPLPDAGIIDALEVDMDAIWSGIRRHLGEVPMAGVFHSLSGILALLQIAKRGLCWEALALLDPALTPPTGHPLMALKREATEAMVKRVVTRSVQFPSIEAYAAFLRRRPEFRHWREGAYESFASATMRTDPRTGEVVLRVLPTAEAQIYRENVRPNLTEALADLPIPTRFICSDLTAPHASPIPKICAAIAAEYGLGFETIVGTTHMLPLEEPGVCAEAVFRFLGDGVLPPSS